MKVKEESEKAGSKLNIQKYATRDSKALTKEKQSKECDPKTK